MRRQTDISESHPYPGRLIKTCQVESSFNSTLVQLKVTDLLFDENDKVGFNSTLVQLKAVGFALPDGVDFRFQFYLSSIKSLRE